MREIATSKKISCLHGDNASAESRRPISHFLPLEEIARHADCFSLVVCPVKEGGAVTGGYSLASGIWPAVSGAVANAQAVDVISNNLANSNTDGFKKDAPTFKEYLSVLERDNHLQQDIPRGPIKDKDFYPIDGRDQAFVVVDGTYTDFSQGRLKVTQAPLDVALDGPGFIEVSTPEGVRYTRQGSLKMAMDGRLVTSEGYPVLSARPGGLVSALPATTVQPGQGGPVTQGGVSAGPSPEVLARFINLRDQQGPVSITEKGELHVGDRLIAQLSVAEFLDPNGLRKVGSGLFENADPANLSTEPARTAVRQGMVETSNVNPVEEMTNLIKAHRLYEHDLKAIKAYDSMMELEAGSIGKL